MPKVKTRRSAAKRFKVTASGKFKRQKGYHRHLMASKSPKRKRNLRKAELVSAVDVPRVKRMLPYA